LTTGMEAFGSIPFREIPYPPIDVSRFK